MEENIRFGFEYETLIEPKTSFWDIVITTVNNIKSGAYNTICDNVFNEIKSDLEKINPNEYDKMIQILYTAPYDAGAEDYFIDPRYANISSPDSQRREQLALAKDPSTLLLYRFVLAALFNNVIRTSGDRNLQKYYFKGETISGDICDSFNLNDQRLYQSRNRGTSIWKVTHDSSVERIGNEFLYKRIEGRTIKKIISYLRCIELVSPVLTYNDVNEDLETLINTILPANRMLVYWNNHRTSNHVHLSYQGFDFRQNPYAIVKLCMAWWYV